MVVSYKSAISDFNSMLDIVTTYCGKEPSLSCFSLAVRQLKVLATNYNDKILQLTGSDEDSLTKEDKKEIDDFFSDDRKPHIREFIELTEQLTGVPDITFRRLKSFPQPTEIYSFWFVLFNKAQRLRGL